MHKHFRLPGDPVLPGTLFSDARFPGVHRGGHEIIILTGPERIFASYGLGHIPAAHMQFVVVRYERGGETLVHVHPDQVQLYYVVSGRATVFVGRSEIAMGPGCHVLIPPDEPHGFRNDGDEPLLLLDVHSYLFEEGAPTTLTVEHCALGRGEERAAVGRRDRETAFFVLEGEGIATVDDETVRIGANSLIFVPRGVAHRLANDAGATLRLVGIDSVDDARAPESSRAPAPVISPLIDPVPASKERVN